MDKFSPLEPTRLYQPPQTTSRFRSYPSTLQKTPIAAPLIGRLPANLHLLILVHLPVPDIPSYARASRQTAGLARDEKTWETRWKALGVDPGSVLDELETKVKSQTAANRAKAPPTLAVDSMDNDDFGDFASVNLNTFNGDFVNGFNAISSLSIARPTTSTFRSKYTRAHNLLKPLLSKLSEPPHLVLSSLSAALPNASLRLQAQTLHLLSLFLSPSIQPIRTWLTLYSSLRSAMDRFEANLLAAFDIADSNSNEPAMREAAESSWEVYDPSSGDWELGKSWADKREIFYEQGRWKPLDNFQSGERLDFDAMDEFMGSVLDVLGEWGRRAVRVFPPESGVLISFAERVSVEVVGEYITPLLMRAREISPAVFLQATAATFKEAWRMVDVIMEVVKEREDSMVERVRAEDVVYQMFEINMDEYLDDEVEAVKLAFDVICREWDKKSHITSSSSSRNEPTRFLSSQNPALVKRNVLASFTDILLMPVTIVPRAVGSVGNLVMEGGRGAVQGIGMLNPARWAGGGVSGAGGYSKNFDGTMIFDGEEEEREKLDVPNKTLTISASASPSSSATNLSTTPTSLNSSSTTISRPQTHKLELLLSLDVALELIHADRESMKRVETFSGYPGHYGFRVRDTIEELFILLLKALGERHVERGFAQATEQMTAYKPADNEDTTSVAPLVQFFELVHIGDTIQSMVQVYFDKELAPHIDKTDFLNAVVREKKRFENALDDSVAAGLNAGTQVLMNQVEHIILTLTQPREYYPPEDAPLDLGPTKGCTEAIKCLDVHCKLLKGSTSKEVLEVFYQEVGIRLIAILQKHIKRQIISLQGGFQVIADLNTYYNFISSLKVPAITADFSHLKMLGHVFVVEDAKDLAQIVRDVTRYGGAYRPEDIYEFVQRRSDWKKIEKTVDKTMYNLSFKEDCVVC